MSLTIVLKDKQVGEYAGDADLGDIVTIQVPDGSYVTGEVEYLIDSNDLGALVYLLDGEAA